MTTTSNNNGRLGNQIIRNLAVSFIAKKYDLQVNYSSYDLINKLGIPLFSGSNLFEHTIELTDDNYFSVYESDSLRCNLNPNNNFFQTKQITNLLHSYIHSEEIKRNIMVKNPFKERYNNNNDLFIHIRLTDVAWFNPGLTYYINAIKNVQFDNLYISTDEPNHSIVLELLRLNSAAQIIHYDEIQTFQFASTCKHIILSHGSFSAIIGYLSFYSTIYFPEFEEKKIWYGDMFSIDGWIKLGVV